jgi:putative Holliday junction resolvase
MGLDVGTKTVGVALSDELGITAQPMTTVRRTNLRADLKVLKELSLEHDVRRFIVGLPLNMDGTEGERAFASRAFAAALEEATELPTVLWDERLTTVAAQRVLLEADVSRAKRKKVVDQIAAALILQGWLDLKRGQAELEDDQEG